MELLVGNQEYGFCIESHEDLPEIEGTATLMRHQSGARLLLLSNNDEDKAFSIAFKTPPANDTGVFHILEHSVLCGSKKFPVKEPFVNLLKSSMETFLNAMTFSDKTMYPVSSTNEKDLMNLIDVYMDAVLHPAIYEREAIFKQEGWHYELSEPEGELRYNGVVYNEMKGVMADPDSVLFDAVQAALFPDSAYRFESGGLPSAIPDLTYEEFLDTHARHYRLDNSYITLYGNLNVDTLLEFLDSNYLSQTTPASSVGEPNPLGFQDPIENLDIQVTMQTAPENACLGLGYVIGTAQDNDKIIACDILFDALMGSNESPLKKVLLEADVAGDVFAFMDKSTLQPYVLIEAKNAHKSTEEFRAIFEQEVTKLLEGGIDKDLIRGALSHAEFIMREADFGMSTGVVLAMNSLSGWLYDDTQAVEPLRYEPVFARLRELLESDYFEQLLSEIVLTNKHRSSVSVLPTDQETSHERAKLSEVEAGLDQSQLEAIAQETQELHRIQMEPDSPEALATLPLLELSDIKEPAKEPAWRYSENFPLPSLKHDVSTHGIDYVRFVFDLGNIAYKEVPYASLLAILLGKLDTENLSASEIDTQTLLHVGALSFSVIAYENEQAPQGLAPKLVVTLSTLSQKLGYGLDLVKEIWAHTAFDDPAKIQTILLQRKIMLEQQFATSGNACAQMRLAAGYSPAGAFLEQVSGVEHYRFISALLEDFDRRFPDLAKKLQSLKDRIFAKENAVVSFAGSDEDFASLWELGGSFSLNSSEKQQSEQAGRTLTIPDPTPQNEAFIIPGDVCYVGAASTRELTEAPEFSGISSVMARILSFDYLWNEVRVKGGAYGVSFKPLRTGGLFFTSFRDPHIQETLDRYNNTGAWLESFNPSEEEMRGYIISSVAAFDAPIKPRSLALRQDSQFFSELPDNWREKPRRDILDATPADIRDRADMFKRFKDTESICIFGSKDAIDNIKFDIERIELFS